MKLNKDEIKAVFFDLDGTLMDTDNQTVVKFTRLFGKLRFCHPEKLARRLVMASETPVNGLITMLDKLGIDEPLMNFWQRLSLKKDPDKYDFQIIPGVKEMLKKLIGNYHLAIVTTRSRTEAEAFLRNNELEDFFELVVHRTSTRRLKPHPEPVLFAAKQLDVPVEHCLMVGDTTPDIRSAKTAGAFSVGVLCGYGTLEELKKAGATLVVEHIREMGELLGAGNKTIDKQSLN